MNKNQKHEFAPFDRMPGTMVLRKIEDLTPYDRNARKHSPEQIQALQKSIREFGFVMPALIAEDGGVIAGEGRLLAAKLEGIEFVPCVIVEHLTDTQRRAYIIADNRLAEHASWDHEVLALELRQLMDCGVDIGLTGFDEVDVLMLEESLLEEPVDAADDGYDNFENAECRVNKGDIWQLGNHRLLCGSCADKAAMDIFLSGVSVDLLLTDPPYGVDYVGKNDDALTIENDDLSFDQLKKLLESGMGNALSHMRAGAAFYVWYASVSTLPFYKAFESLGLQIRQQLIWMKSQFVLGRSDYHWQHEPCLYGWLDGAAHAWMNDRCQTTILTFDKPVANKEHPTMKPVPLFDYQMRNNTKPHDVVLDIFGGSGTTLICAEQAERRCYMVEIDPRYCDIIIDRWEQLTGKKAMLVRNISEGGDSDASKKAT